MKAEDLIRQGREAIAVTLAGLPEGGRPRIDHLGIAVASIAAARGLYEALGLKVEREETIAGEGVRTAMLPAGEARIELLEPTAEDTLIGRFLARHGQGLHHVALSVTDLAACVTRLKAAGVRLVTDRVQIGAGGHRYVFIHPAAAGGVLVELVESSGPEMGKP